VLVRNLPIDSAVARRQRGHHWTDETYLLADIRDATVVHRAEYVSAHSDGPAPPFEAVPRPGVDAEAPRKASRSAHDRVMSKMKRGAAA
jgi:hypothetical protein